MGQREVAKVPSIGASREWLLLQPKPRTFTRYPIRTFITTGPRNGATQGFSKKLENLEAACAMFLAYYNFCCGPETRKRAGLDYRPR